MSEFLDLASIPQRRGVYTADRAAQLSGVPRTTVYYWARASRLVIPSISPQKLKLWSYRDLILLRFVAWLRKNEVKVPEVRKIVKAVRDETHPLQIRVAQGRAFRSTRDPHAIEDILSNQTALAGELAKWLPEFELEATEVDELGRRKLWGPDLLRPSAHTRIHPDVLSGEPFIESTRIPTSALFALSERNLSPERIGELYSLKPKAVEEVLWLESSVRAGKKLPIAA